MWFFCELNKNFFYMPLCCNRIIKLVGGSRRRLYRWHPRTENAAMWGEMDSKILADVTCKDERQLPWLVTLHGESDPWSVLIHHNGYVKTTFLFNLECWLRELTDLGISLNFIITSLKQVEGHYSQLFSFNNYILMLNIQKWCCRLIITFFYPALILFMHIEMKLSLRMGNMFTVWIEWEMKQFLRNTYLHLFA